MNRIRLENSWTIRAPVEDVFRIVTDFENFPKYFPKVAQSVVITKKEGNTLGIEAKVKSFGKTFPVRMRTEILPLRGFVSDNESPDFGTSGHEELLLEKAELETKIRYVYEVEIHKAWLRIVAKPLIGWFAMRAWERAIIDELRRILENGERTAIGSTALPIGTHQAGTAEVDEEIQDAMDAIGSLWNRKKDPP